VILTLPELVVTNSPDVIGADVIGADVIGEDVIGEVETLALVMRGALVMERILTVKGIEVARHPFLIAVTLTKELWVTLMTGAVSPVLHK